MWKRNKYARKFVGNAREEYDDVDYKAIVIGNNHVTYYNLLNKSNN